MKPTKFLPTKYLTYQKYFSLPGVRDKVVSVAKKAGRKVVYAVLLLYYVYTDPKVSRKDKAIIAGALGYFILPMDFLPDAMPLAGYTDDMTALVWALKSVWENITPEIKEKAREKMRKWFGEVDEAELSEILK